MNEQRILSTLKRFDPDAGHIVLTPEAEGNGYWVGCPGILRDPETGTFLLTYRRRRPRGLGAERGWRCAIAASDDGLHFSDIWHVDKEQLGTPSMERFRLMREPGGVYLLYISYVDPLDNRWRIDVLEAPTPDGFDVGAATAVLTAKSTGTEGVKDPYTFRHGDQTFMLASFASAEGIARTDRARAHSNADIYTTGLTTHPTGLATSADGRNFHWHGQALPVGQGWDRYQARLNSVTRIADGWLGFYDGSAGAEENYEERCGLAVSDDLREWRSISPAAPWVTSSFATGSLRYVDVLEVDDELWLYYECARQDGAHDLRMSRIAR